MALLSAKELAEQLGVNPETVKRAFRRQQIPGERIGKVLRFDINHVREAMRERERQFRQATIDRKVGKARRGAEPGARRAERRPREGNTGARIAAPKR